MMMRFLFSFSFCPYILRPPLHSPFLYLLNYISIHFGIIARSVFRDSVRLAYVHPIRKLHRESCFFFPLVLFTKVALFPPAGPSLSLSAVS